MHHSIIKMLQFSRFAVPMVGSGKNKCGPKKNQANCINYLLLRHLRILGPYPAGHHL